jgi:hypothetical protein
MPIGASASPTSPAGCLDATDLTPDTVTPIDDATGLPRWLLVGSDWTVVLGYPCEAPTETPTDEVPVQLP